MYLALGEKKYRIKIHVRWCVRACVCACVRVCVGCVGCVGCVEYVIPLTFDVPFPCFPSLSPHHPHATSTLLRSFFFFFFFFLILFFSFVFPHPSCSLPSIIYRSPRLRLSHTTPKPHPLYNCGPPRPHGLRLARASRFQFSYHHRRHHHHHPTLL